jgi:ACS family glucarate transporter-like MFS transporter
MADSLRSHPGLAASPTHVRWRIVGLLLATAALCHFNRISIAVAGSERLMADYDLSPAAMGSVYSTYLLAYTLFMTPGGWFIDRVGSRAALALVGFGSAVCVALLGLTGLIVSSVVALPALVLICIAMGVVTAPTHPAAARSVAAWLPLTRQPLGNGLVNAAATLGIASSYTAFGALMDNFGWPSAFGISALVTTFVAIVWTAAAADRPSDHPRVNEAERRLIEDAAKHAHAVSGAHAVALLRSRALVLLTLSYAGLCYFKYMFFYWLPFYFNGVLGMSIGESRIYATIPTLGLAAGMSVGGWLAGRLELRLGPRRGLAIVPAMGMVGGAVLLWAGARQQEPSWTGAFFLLALTAAGTCEGPFWSAATQIGGRRAATAAAVLNTGGNAFGLLAPVVTPLLGAAFGWQRSLGLASLLCLLGALLWIRIDPTPRPADDGSQ